MARPSRGRAGRPAAARAARAAEQRGEVQPRVEPAGEDEVPVVEAEPLAQARRCPPPTRRRPTARTPAAARAGRRAAGRDGCAGAAGRLGPSPSLPTMTAAASRRSWARRRCPKRLPIERWKASGSSHGARSRRVTTTGRPEAIGSGPPPTAW